MKVVKHEIQPPIRSQRKKELYKLLVARSDITASLEACKLMLKHVDGIGNKLYYPLYAAIVVCYARPFTKNRPYGSLPKRWSQFDSEPMKRTHNKLIKARHELIAHSDMTIREAMIVPPNVAMGAKDGKNLKSPEIGVQTTMYYYPLDFFKNVHKTAHDLGSRLNTEIDKVVEELYGGMELPNAAFKIRIDEGL
ncbi:MAG: hypothetical protein ACE5GU_09060 [Candidatus Scalinduaceae bacterium]